MNKIFVIGDIHGEFDKLQSVLKNINIDYKNDKVIFLGDYIDRGEESFEVVEYLITQKQKYPDTFVFLKGNHEDLLLNAITEKLSKDIWLFNGGRKTIDSYKKNKYYFPDIPHFDFYKELIPYYETKNFIFVHAGIDENQELKNTSENVFLWERNNFVKDTYSKTVILGHTIVDKPMFIKNKNILIDTGSFIINGFITCLELSKGDNSKKEDMKFYRSY